MVETLRGASSEDSTSRELFEECRIPLGNFAWRIFVLHYNPSIEGSNAKRREFQRYCFQFREEGQVMRHARTRLLWNMCTWPSDARVQFIKTSEICWITLGRDSSWRKKISLKQHSKPFRWPNFILIKLTLILTNATLWQYGRLWLV